MTMVKRRRSRLSKHNPQIQTSNRFLLLEEILGDWNEAVNGDQEEIYPNDNIPTRQKEKQQCRTPEFPITESYIKTDCGYIKNFKKLHQATKHMLKLLGTFGKLE